jgi:NTE family protein
VLEVLEEAGIRPDVVAGTSAGSLVGALYCAGMPVADIKAEALELKWSKLGRVTRPSLGWFDITRLQDRVDKLVEGRPFAELPVRFAAVAVDILAGEIVVLREGSVAEAVRASCSMPGIFTPVARGERLLVDGGLLNNMPVSVARDMGADYVIAVDLFPRGQRFKQPRHLAEMAMLTYYNMACLAHRERDDANCLIMPAIGHQSIMDFSNTEEFIAKGRQAAQLALPQLQQDLRL